MILNRDMQFATIEGIRFSAFGVYAEFIFFVYVERFVFYCLWDLLIHLSVDDVASFHVGIFFHITR